MSILNKYKKTLFKLKENLQPLSKEETITKTSQKTNIWLDNFAQN
jgi:hypothetical protein